jgi:two-component system cell cycle response regulator
MSDPQQPQSQPPPPARADEARPVVLVVDDSPDVHRLLRARLRSEELDLLSAENGTDGFKQAGGAQPALILLDLDMPGVNGFETLRLLKADRATMQIPVIVLSGATGTEDKVTAFELGAVDYVTKPFEFTELRVRLRSALKMHQLIKMLAEKAQLDGLTGLWNRRYFEERWAEEVSRTSRKPRALSVAFIDVDHFKSVNDTYGHPAGDAVLQALAKLLRRETRQSDLPCRYGGEEFVLIMPDTPPDDATNLCERIRAALEATVWPRHPERRITASFGVAGAVGMPSVAAEAWVEQADKCVYASKKGGRNRVTSVDLSSAKPRLAGEAA